MAASRGMTMRETATESPSSAIDCHKNIAAVAESVRSQLGIRGRNTTTTHPTLLLLLLLRRRRLRPLHFLESTGARERQAWHEMNEWQPPLNLSSERRKSHRRQQKR